MTLTLALKSPSTLAIEVEGIIPERLRSKSLAEVERLEIVQGNRRLPLGELFTVAGDAADEHLAWQGNLERVHRIGAKLTSGRITIEGNVGRHLGSEMRGGEIHLHGSAADFVGTAMHGGLIHLRGNAGERLGGAFHGSSRGMTRGTIIVQGNVGAEAGLAMRRGLIAVGGNCGDLVGANMLAGTILVFGSVGNSPGLAMRRGTIAALGAPPKLLPTFRHACRFQPTFLRMFAHELKNFDLPHASAALQAPVELFHGDLAELGRGELLTASA